MPTPTVTRKKRSFALNKQKPTKTKARGKAKVDEGTTVQLSLPPKLTPVFMGPARYRGAWGGRGSGKSVSFAKMLAVRGYMEPIRILCCREIQSSLKDSSMSEIINAIESEPFLSAAYEIGESYIRGYNGTEFIFRGLRQNAREIKSLSNVNICWVEEAEAVSEKSWSFLIPTIRAKDSEIWVTWNPESKDSATYKRFIEAPPANSKIIRLNYMDNPWFPDVLNDERLHDLARDPAYYAHVWLGECLTRTDAQVMAGKWSVRPFEPEAGWNGPYYGLDFGFSQDPTMLVQSYINGRKLFVRGEAGKTGLEVDATAAFLERTFPQIGKAIIRADSSRPETISYLKRNGLPLLRPAKKWPGSIEDGISFLRSFDEIVIHPHCKNTISNFRLYSYKIDRLTEEVTTDIISGEDHCIDAIRYSLEPLIRMKGVPGIRAL